jgi:DNA-binding transcriptional regulator YiaG
MGVDQVDNGYAAYDAAIARNIQSDIAIRGCTAEITKPSKLRYTFQAVQKSTLAGDSNYSWEFIDKNSSGGFLVKGRNISKFIAQKSTNISTNIVNFGLKLSLIKDTFDLTNEQLADVMGSGRKTVHNWMNSSNRPNKTKAKRILELDNITNMWMSRGFTANRDTILLQAQSGSSLIELLADENLDKDLVMFHGSSMYFDLSYDVLEDPFA